jgi:UDP-glucose 4-epimerase
VRVLVTGGLGYVGKAVAIRLAEAGHEVTVLTRHRLTELPEPATGVTLLQVDLRDREDIAATVGSQAFQGICDLAGRARVRESFQDPIGYFDTNTTGTINLLRAFAASARPTRPVPRLVFASTIAVYGEPNGRRLDETCPTAPTSPYGASKLAAEQAIGYQAATGALGAVSLRAFAVAGAVGDHGDPDLSRIVPKALAVAQGLAPHVEINGDGSAVRAFTHVADIAEAYLLALEAAQPGKHLVYNVGAGDAVTVNEVLDTVQAVTGRRIPIVRRPAQPEPAILHVDAHRIEQDLGWQPARSTLRQIIEDGWTAMRKSQSRG